MRPPHPTLQNTMASLNNTTEHCKKEHLPCDIIQNLAASSGYQPYIQSTSSGTMYYTLDSAPLHTRPYGEQSPESTGSTHMAANARPLSLKPSERKENIDQSKASL